MIITTSHASMKDGNIFEAPANTIWETLVNEKKDFMFLRHSMDGNMPSTLFYYKRGKIKHKQKVWSISKIAPLRYLSQIIGTIYILFFKLENNENVYIGVDPLNAFTGIILRKIHKANKVVFYTVDYTETRFNNKFLNSIYHFIDKYCVKNADEVWNVSTRIMKVRENMGIAKNKNIFVPNMPSSEYKQFENNKKNIYHLITLGVIDKQLDFIGIFQAIKKLKEKYPSILLKIIGVGPMLNEYKRYVAQQDLVNNVKFCGYLEHSRALEEISKSGIGLALYNGNWSFNYYGDSMKCREYFCFGLPVVTTNTHSTVEDIKKYNAGVVTMLKTKEYITALENIFTHYKDFEANSYKLKEKYHNIHKQLLTKLC